VLDPVPDEQPDVHNEEEQNPVLPQRVSDEPEEWERFKGTFNDMLSKLRPRARKDVEGNTLQDFLKDLEEFGDYIEGLRTGDAEYGQFINDIDGLGEHIEQVVNAVDAASRVWNRYGQSGLNMKQLAENDDAYTERLSRCYGLVKDLLSEFFGT
jgi:hypothetical protein